MTYWRLKGRELVNCSCDYGCNCQFGGLPDKGHCHAAFSMIIDEGVHGDTDLSGLHIGAKLLSKHAIMCGACLRLVAAKVDIGLQPRCAHAANAYPPAPALQSTAST